MKKALLFTLSLFILLGCQSSLKETPPLVFQIKTFDVPNNQMQVQFSLYNPTEEVW